MSKFSLHALLTGTRFQELRVAASGDSYTVALDRKRARTVCAHHITLVFIYSLPHTLICRSKAARSRSSRQRPDPPKSSRVYFCEDGFAHLLLAPPPTLPCVMAVRGCSISMPRTTAVAGASSPYHAYPGNSHLQLTSYHAVCSDADGTEREMAELALGSNSRNIPDSHAHSQMPLPSASEAKFQSTEPTGSSHDDGESHRLVAISPIIIIT